MDAEGEDSAKSGDVTTPFLSGFWLFFLTFLFFFFFFFLFFTFFLTFGCFLIRFFSYSGANAERSNIRKVRRWKFLFFLWRLNFFLLFLGAFLLGQSRQGVFRMVCWPFVGAGAEQRGKLLGNQCVSHREGKKKVVDESFLFYQKFIRFQKRPISRNWWIWRQQEMMQWPDLEQRQCNFGGVVVVVVFFFCEPLVLVVITIDDLILFLFGCVCLILVGC